MSNEQKNNLRIAVYGMLIALIVVAIALVVAFTMPAKTSNLNPEEPSEEVNSTAIVFTNPLDTTNVLKSYSATDLQFNETLNQWEAHKAICLGADNGANVYAVFSGVVESVESTYLQGTTITIKHNDNLKTVYSSLEEEPQVKEGDTVAKGQVIGKVSNSAQAETALGTHLHFEVLKNNVKVDPAEYLMLEDK